MELNVRRGEIYYADLSPVVGSEQGGMRPVLIVQNDVGNRHSPTVIAAAITSQQNKTRLPTHIEISARDYGLSRKSVVLLEQIRTLDKRRLRERMGCLDTALMQRVDDAIAVSFGLTESKSEQKEMDDHPFGNTACATFGSGLFCNCCRVRHAGRSPCYTQLCK